MLSPDAKPVRNLILFASSLLVLAFASRNGLVVLTGPKWLAWILLGCATLPLAIQARLDQASLQSGAVLLLLLALVNQVLYLLAGTQTLFSLLSLRMALAAACVPLALWALRRTAIHKALPGMLVALPVWLATWRFGLSGLGNTAARHSFGPELYSVPFGYKTEVVALALAMAAALWPRLSLRQRYASMAPVALTAWLVQSQIGMYAAAAGLLYAAIAARPALRQRRVWIVLATAVFVPLGVVAVWGWAGGHASAATRLWLWLGGILSRSWWSPLEAGAAIAATSRAEQLAPLLIQRGIGRFPVHMHNDFLQLGLQGGWIVLLAMTALVRGSNVRLQIVRPDLLVLLAPLFAVDSLVFRPLGLFLLAIALHGALRIEWGQWQPESRAVRQGWPALIVATIVLAAPAALQPFVPTQACRVIIAPDILTARICTPGMDPRSTTYAKILAWNMAIRPGLPATAILQANQLLATDKELAAARILRKTERSWHGIRLRP